MILELPPYTQQQADTRTFVAKGNIHTSNYSYMPATINLLPTDLVDRLIIDRMATWGKDTIVFYNLILSTGPENHIYIESQHLDLLNYYMRAILADQDVTLEETKSKFPELFV
jgi:hypothetical protein